MGREEIIMDINKVINYLNKLYPNAKCSLDYKKDYQLVIATMLSAQTTDEAVNKVTRVLFNKYKSLDSLSKANVKDIENIIHPLGMYKRKAINIIGIAKGLKKGIPDNREELMKLPGVGQKVANVVLAELYHLPYFAVDTHCSRISKRLGIAKEKDNPKIIEEKILKLVNKNHLILLNHQMIEFGRNICSAKNPKCNKCKLHCKYLSTIDK